MEVPQDAWGNIAGTVETTAEDFDVLHALYQAEIAYLEEKIKTIKDLLKAKGGWDDMLFIVTSEPGEKIGEQALVDLHYALYDILLHVPLYVPGGCFEDCVREDLV